MDVRGPTPGQKLNPNELSQLQSDTHRLESAGRTVPDGHLQQPSSAEHLRAPEVVQLAEQLRSIPEVRSEVVSRIEQKLKAGAYETRNSAEQTAAALLGLEDETA